MQFLASPKPERSFFVTLRRREVSDELGAAIFAAAPGDLVGPSRVENGYVVTLMLSLTQARLDEPTRTAVKETLMEEWLAEERRTAKVTWYWGGSERAREAAS